MRLLRVDDNQIAGANLHAPLAVDIGADAAGDGTDGKEFVAVQAVTRLAAIRDGAGFDERQLRIDLAAAYRLLAHYGMDDLIYTHTSVRLPGEGHRFLINPYGMLFEEITASSLVVVDAEGEPMQETSWPVNPAGFVIHSALHLASPAFADGARLPERFTADGAGVSPPPRAR